MAQQPTHVDVSLGGNAMPGGGYLKDVENLVQNDVYNPLGNLESHFGWPTGQSVQPTAELGPASIAYEKEQKAKGKEEAAAKKAAAKSAAEQKAIEEQIQAVQNSPWTKLSNALVSEYQQEETPVAALVSGAGIPGAQNAAAAGALGSLGLSPGSSAGQWLSAQTGAAQAQTAPIAQAMAQEGAQYQAEMGPISKAIQAYGEANALSDITAPEQAWLSALSSHITSNLSYQGVVPTAALPSLNPAVVKALQLSGGYGGSAGAGTTPLQNVGAAPGGGSRALSTAGVSPGQISTGIVPKASPSAGG